MRKVKRRTDTKFKDIDILRKLCIFDSRNMCITMWDEKTGSFKETKLKWGVRKLPT